MAATFAAPRFEKFIPYTPAKPRTARRPPSKEASACRPEELDMDEMIKAFDEQGDKFLDTLAATPSFHASDGGSQTGSAQNVVEDIGYAESNSVTSNLASNSGAVSEIATPSIPFLPPADDASGLQAALGYEEDCILKRHDHRPGSPRVVVDLPGDTLEVAVAPLARIGECRDGTPPTDALGVLQSADEQQRMNNAHPGASNDAVHPGERPSEAAHDTDLGFGDARSPSQCSIAQLDSPPPSDDSMSEIWPSGTPLTVSSDDEIEPRQPERASRHKKQRSPYSRKRVTPSSSKRQGSCRVRKPMRPRRLPQGSSESKRTDLGAITDAPQIPLNSYRSRGGLMPQKLAQINLRQLACGETFLAAVIQDKREVAAFAYDQSVTLIKRSIGSDWEVDGLGIMPINLNSWLLTGFLRINECQDSRPATRRGYLVNDDIDDFSAGRTVSLYADHVEPDRLTDLLHEAVSQDKHSSIEDDLQPSDEKMPRVMTRHRKPPWTPKEEQVLADLVNHKSWEEIGELLGRPPGGVSQRWRKMQLAVASGVKPRLKRRNMLSRASVYN